MPYEHDGAGASLKEINDFASLLGTAIPAGDKETVALAVDTIGSELRELTERYPDRKNTSVSGGEQERAIARAALKELVLILRRIEMAVGEGRTADAAADYQELSVSDGCRRSLAARQRRAMVTVQCRGA